MAARQRRPTGCGVGERFAIAERRPPARRVDSPPTICAGPKAGAPRRTGVAPVSDITLEQFCRKVMDGGTLTFQHGKQ